jgi:hypothetical protein
MNDISLYRERAHLVALLAALYPSSIGTDPAEPDWPVVYITLPTGQVSWHFSPDDQDLLFGVPRDDNTRWDGHTTDEKYRRIADHAARLTRSRWSSTPDDVELPWHTLEHVIEPDLFTGEPTPGYRLLHPQECQYLPPGAVCWAAHDPMQGWWPAELGRYRIRPVTQCVGGYEEPDYETHLEIEPETAAAGV